MARLMDATWIPRLKGAERVSAIGDLQKMLTQSLANFDAPLEDKEDFVQSATFNILNKLDTFQGKSKFSTWAISIVINTAVSEMRKKYWSDISIESLCEIKAMPSTYESPEHILHKSWVNELISNLINEQLTEKQRKALLAELAGMPLQEIGSKMGVSRGAIYKLTFDARKKLLKCLEDRNLKLSDLIIDVE